MIPYNRKLWGVHPREITDAWCDRFVPTPSADEVVRGALGTAQDKIGYNSSFLYPKRGIGDLATAMALKAGNIEYNTAPSAINYKKQTMRVKGSWVPYQSIISSIPLDKLIGLLVDPPASIVEAASGLRCTSLRYLDVALNRRPGTDYHWSYVPERKYPFYRVGSYSNFSKAMAPRGKGSLYVELASRSPVNMKTLMPKVITGLTEMGIIKTPSDIAFARARFIKHAYVVYDQKYSVAVNRIHKWLIQRDIHSVGRYGKWEYAAMENAVEQGFLAAEEVLKR